MRTFNYDVVHLITSVRDRPCLWDKSLETHKDRVERRAAWIEVFNILDDGYAEMTPEDKKITEDIILSKWINIRDAFLKSLKKMRAGKCRKYVLHREMAFLAKNLQISTSVPDDAAGFNDSDSSMKQEDDCEKEVPSFSSRRQARWTDRYKRKYEDTSDNVEFETFTTKKQAHDDTGASDMNFVGVDEVNDPRVMNEDEAFFASLLPTVVNYNEDERLDFRIEVLALMKKIKNRRQTEYKCIISD